MGGSRRFLVYGAAGHAGSQVARALAERRQLVLAPIRGFGRTLSIAATALPFDPADDFPYDTALEGVDGIFLLAGVRHADRLLAAAEKHGVRRVVVLSSAATEHEELDDPLTRMHRRTEQAVTASALGWTILRPQAFASNASRWAPQIRSGDEVALAFPDVALASVDPRDLGDVAATALIDPGHAGRVYRLSGPQALLPAEQVEVIARTIGRSLRARELADTEARALLEGSLPPAAVASLFTMYRESAYDEGVVTSTVEDVLGRPSSSFAEWTDRNSSVFRSRTG